MIINEGDRREERGNERGEEGKSREKNMGFKASTKTPKKVL